jgi:deoxyadenosine/deoxycytidine kinase
MKLFIYLHVAVYLKADPTTCQGRIRKRARMEEKDVPLVSVSVYNPLQSPEEETCEISVM